MQIYPGQKFLRSFFSYLLIFESIFRLYAKFLQMTNDKKMTKGSKNKPVGFTLAMSGLYPNNFSTESNKQ